MRGFALVLMSWAIIGMLSCDKEPTNPFDDYNQPEEEPIDTSSIDPNSIQGLHKNIFKPTCANSGCHDGTFEPDFRTIESSYNTLVEHPVISNTPDNLYVNRVVKGNVSESLLYHRLTQFIPNSSGIMPLEVDAESDWNEKQDEYINNVRTWIENGAKDMFGG